MNRELIAGAALRTMLDNTEDMVFVKDADLIYIAASNPFVKMVGKNTVEEIVGRTDLEIFEDENLARRYIADDRKLLGSGENLVDYIEPITEKDGQARYGSTSKYILTDTQGCQIGILGVTKDITREYKARQRYQQVLKYLFEVPEDTYEVTYIDVDSWRIITQRKRTIGKGSLQTCYTVEELCEAAIDSIVDRESDGAEFYRQFTPQYLHEIYEEGKSSIAFEYQRRMTDDTIRWVRNEVRFLVDVDSGHLCVMLSAKDIETIKQEEQELVVAARMDRMTMLLNRETSMEYIRHTLLEDAEKSHALFMLDVDNFKQVNDTWGHQAGDEFLMRLAKAVKECFNESDIIGRIGGDEFFVLMKNCGEKAVIEKKAQRLLETIRKICVGYEELELSGSVGISRYPQNGKTLEELYAKADVALYEAKRGGKNQFVICEADL